MTFFSEPGHRGNRLPVVAAQSFVLEQLVSIHAHDPRHALGDGRAGVAFVHGNVRVCTGAVGRVGPEGPYTTGRRRGMAGIAAADTMVAAGGR